MKAAIIILVFLVSGLLTYIFFSLPDMESLKKQNPDKTSFMEYREKQWKKQGKKYSIHRVWVPLSQISPYLITSVLIAEDDKFWSHEGFDYEAMQIAIERDIKAQKFKFGGSTISQQVAKNLYLKPSKNPLRKIMEAVITWRIEQVLTKKRILEIYLNIAEWGDKGIFGIEAASRHYYGKPASTLTPEESARLASVLPSPRKYNPLGNSKYMVSRSNLIYSIMIKRGIVAPEYEEETKEEIQTGAVNPEPQSSDLPQTETPKADVPQPDAATPVAPKL